MVRFGAVLLLSSVFFGVGLLLVPAMAGAQNRPAILVTDPSAKAYKSATQRFADKSAFPDEERAERFRQQINAALEFSGLFKAVATEAFLGPVTTSNFDEDPVCPTWRSIGADVLIEGEMVVESETFFVKVRARDVSRNCRTILSTKKFRGMLEGEVASRIADEVVRAFTGKLGVASTEIAFASNRKGNKEIYVMNVDGTNLREATRNGSINSFPSWSPDGEQIVFASFMHKSRSAVYVVGRGENQRAKRIRGQLPSMAPQYRGVLDPLGKHLAVIMSVGGQTELYVARRDGRRLKRLTNNRGLDIAPGWSPDGKRLVFASDRGGSPQLYIIDRDGANLRRLTFEGSYNTGPSWSPDGNWIAYESRHGGQFDIWLTDPEGTVNAPLITHPRSDEQPSWSPDGRKVVFTSNRRGNMDIYIVDITGDNLRQLTRGAGDNMNPAWGPFPR